MLTINNTLDGYLKGVEIKGNTVQDSENLADIRSVGDKVEGQELYEIPVLIKGKNLFYGELESGRYYASSGDPTDSVNYVRGKNFIPVNPLLDLCINFKYKGTQKYSAHISEYDIEYKFIKDTYNTNGTYILGATTRFVRVTLYCGNIGATVPPSDVTDVQLECGTQATPYEPYIENKLTILSPTQLEKVGDVCDRIIEKDGVWGVEKNVIDKLFNGSENWVLSGWAPQENTIAFKLQNTNNTNLGICDKFILNRNNSTIDTEAFNVDSVWNEISIRINKSKLSTQDVTGFKKWLSDNTVLIMYSDNTSTFIPLPHDQQIKLRTFANKTNISFLTEIEGTIKAQVPKSLGATVNTHTEQINNLNKELDRVKKLEESTVSTVTTESDFTTVEATSNGYFEDVKLEGKTLVNYISNFNNWSNMGNTTVSEDGASMTINATSWNKGRQISKSLPIGEYIFSINNPNNATIIVQNKTNAKTLLMGNNIDMNIKFSLLEVSEILITCKNTSETGTYVVNNPILTTDKNVNGYFEGLKSVGQSATTSEDGVDEISVESVDGDGNLLFFKKDVLYKSNGITYTIDSKTQVITVNGTSDADNVTCYAYDALPKQLYNGVYSCTVEKLTDFSSPIIIRTYNKDFTNGVVLNLQDSLSATIRKPYVNDEIAFSLRVDKGATFNNAKFKVSFYKGDIKKEYTPHQSDKKRLLYYNTETQTWEKPILRQWDSIEKHTDGKYYYHVRSIEEDYVEGDEIVTDYITDMTTTVKPLSQEKVYECANIDLITYNGETNYIVESGVLSPKTTLKVHNNISNVVSLLQKKVSLLESNITSYMITQNRLMLASRYNADNVTFKVDYPSMMSEREVEIDYDLFKLIQDNIIVGPKNYDVDKMLEIMDLYAMIGFITWEMWDYLYEVIYSQINPVIEDLEGTPEI